MTPRVPILGSRLRHSSRLSPPPEGPEESFWKPGSSPDSGVEPDVLGRAVPSGEEEQQNRGYHTGDTLSEGQYFVFHPKDDRAYSTTCSLPDNAKSLPSGMSLNPQSKQLCDVNDAPPPPHPSAEKEA